MRPVGKIKTIARIITGGFGAVAVSVAANQVLSGDQLSWSWAYVSVGLAVLFAVYAEVFAPETQQPPDRREATGRLASRPGSTVVRGRRAVYLRQLRAHVRDMETTGIATQGEFVLRLQEVYVDVSLRSHTPHGSAAAPYVGQVGTWAGERRSLSEFLSSGDEGRVYAVIGGPGSGKTTLMRATAGGLCHRRWRHRRLPVLLYLRDHLTMITTYPERDLDEVAATASWVTGRTSASWIARRLERGGCLVMLDGLDEVANQTQRTAVVEWVRRQIDRYPGNDYLVTSRPHGYLSNPLTRAEVLQVRRFTSEQISQFLHAWYYTIECRSTATTGKQPQAVAHAKAEDLLRRLRARPGLYGLAANPLLLTMIANVHRYRGALPGSRAELYAEMCQVLVHRRQESKGLTDVTGLSGPQKEHIVRVLAWTMMTTKIRDIPADDAHAVITPVLRQISRKVTPSVFLKEARKSGLLVEREYDRYAFAHLTLQEYLAAAHVGEDHHVEQLTGAVDDPWWRETTLLWVAGADATPVISACLTSGTIRALALAFDCAEEALKVDPNVAEALEDLLTTPGADTGARARLITKVKAARSFRDVIWLNDDTAICARPVPRPLYTLFARDEQSKGRCTPTVNSDPAREDADDETPVTGMWAGDVTRFVNWLNDLVDDGTAYRLPTPAELADPAIGMVTDLARHTIWAQADPRPHLYQPDNAPWFYTPDPDRLRRYPVSDRAQLIPYLRLVLAATLNQDDARVLAYSHVVAAALTRHDASRQRILDLALAHSLAHALVHTRASDRDSAGDLDPTHDLTHNLGLARGLDLELARNLARALDRDFGRALDYDLDPNLARDRDLARDLAFALARDLDQDQDLDRARARALDLAFAIDLPLDLALTRDVAHDLDLAFARALNRALDHNRELNLALDLNHDLALDLAVDLDRASDRSLDRVLDRALNRTLDSTRDLDFTPALDLALARALVLDLVRDPVFDVVRLRIYAKALGCLLTCWAPTRNRRIRAGAALEDFDTFLVGALPKTTTPIPHDPAVPLQRAQDLLDDCSARHPISSSSPLDKACSLISDIQELITPILKRTAAYHEPTLACARLGLLAAATLLHKAQQHQSADLLLDALRSLVALQETAEGRLVPNDVLLLIRI